MPPPPPPLFDYPALEHSDDYIYIHTHTHTCIYIVRFLTSQAPRSSHSVCVSRILPRIHSISFQWGEEGRLLELYL